MFGQKEIFLLDIGSRKLDIFYATAENTVQKISNVECITEVNYSGFCEGKWIDPNEIKKTLSKLISDATKKFGKKKIKKLYVAVPGEFVKVITKELSTNFHEPTIVTNEHIDKIFNDGNTFTSENNHLTISCSALYYTIDDFKRVVDPRGMSVSKLTVLLSYILCDENLINLFRDSLMEEGVKEVEFLSANLAEAVTLFEPSERDNNVILCDIGYITSSVMIIRGDGLLDIKSFSLGGGYIASDIMLCLNISFPLAEIIKNKVNLKLSPELNDKFNVSFKSQKIEVDSNEINEIVKCRLDDFVEIIQFCINKFMYNAPPHLPVYITGGGLSNMRGALTYLSRKLGRPMKYVGPSIPKFNRPNFSSACGALKVIATQNMSKNKEKRFIKKIISKFNRRKN